MSIKYCHDCAEYALRYEIHKMGHSPNIVSDPAKRLFVLTDNKRSVTVSIDKMTVQSVAVTACKDWKILINQVLHQLYS